MNIRKILPGLLNLVITCVLMTIFLVWAFNEEPMNRGEGIGVLIMSICTASLAVTLWAALVLFSKKSKKIKRIQFYAIVFFIVSITSLVASGMVLYSMGLMDISKKLIIVTMFAWVPNLFGLPAFYCLAKLDKLEPVGGADVPR